GLSWMNLANGEFKVCECTPQMLEAELGRIAPAELLCADHAEPPTEADGIAISRAPDWHFEADSARDTLKTHFGVDALGGFGLDPLPLATRAAGALLRYVGATQSQTLSHVQSLAVDAGGEYVVLDPATRRNLELTESLGDGDGPTRFSTLDHCRTPMGSRQLRRWPQAPLRENPPAHARHDAITPPLSPRDRRRATGPPG